MGSRTFENISPAGRSLFFRRVRQVQLLAAGLVIVLATASCGVVAVSQGIVLDEPFRTGQVQAIRNGQTTKQDILHWFGPPLVVARPGTTVRMPKPELLNSLYSDVPAESLFARFSAVVPPPGSPVIYYYEDQKLEWSDMGAIIFLLPVTGKGEDTGGFLAPVSGTINVSRLWVLLDDATQLVAEHQVETETQKLTTNEMKSLEGMWR